MKGNFLPNQDNDYSPHVLQKTAAVAIGVLVVLTFTIANIQSLIWVSSEWLVSTILPAVIVADTNNIRSEDSLPELQRNSVLEAAANEKAKHMADEGYFAHYSPDGVSPWYWIESEGYDFIHAGENLAVHFTDSSAVVNAWMNSPSHRDNILNRDYEEIGIGVAKGTYQGYDTIFVVQMFGTPSHFSSVSEWNGDQSDSEVAVSKELNLNEQEKQFDSTESQVAGDHVNNVEHKVLVSDHMSTSTYTVLNTAINEENINNQNSTVSWISLATQPQTVLQVVYFLIGIFVISCLIISIIIEVRHQRPVQVLYGTALLTLMYVLLQVHLMVSENIVIA